jgi:hypothetical protein
LRIGAAGEHEQRHLRPRRKHPCRRRLGPLRDRAARVPELRGVASDRSAPPLRRAVEVDLRVTERGAHRVEVVHRASRTAPGRRVAEVSTGPVPRWSTRKMTWCSCTAASSVTTP